MYFLIFYRLSDLGLRLFHTPANSVTSERAFSVQNYFYDSKRNRLNSERSAKLQFIYINKHALQYKYPGKKWEEQTWLTLTEDQELAIEETNMADDWTRDEEDEFEEENREVENKSGISIGTWYENDNDKDVEELDKAVEFDKLVSLQPTQFLDVVTWYTTGVWFFFFTDIFLI